MGSETEGGVLDMVIRPMLTYAALVWWKRTHLTTVKKQFGHIQHITFLGMTCCMSTTPTAAMETHLGLPPLQRVVEKEARQAAYRLHCFNHFLKSHWDILLFSRWQRKISSLTGVF
jgi:hypothetical protein